MKTTSRKPVSVSSEKITPLDAGLLARMKTGKQLKTTFQNLQRNDVSVQLPLAGFAESYAKIQ